MLGFAGIIIFRLVGTPLAKGIRAAPSCVAETKNKNYMSTLTAKGNWNIAKGKLKQKIARITDDDLQFAKGKEDELIGRIQKRAMQSKKYYQHEMEEDEY